MQGDFEGGVAAGQEVHDRHEFAGTLLLHGGWLAYIQVNSDANLVRKLVVAAFRVPG